MGEWDDKVAALNSQIASINSQIHGAQEELFSTAAHQEDTSTQEHRIDALITQREGLVQQRDDAAARARQQRDRDAARAQVQQAGAQQVVNEAVDMATGPPNAQSPDPPPPPPPPPSAPPSAPPPLGFQESIEAGQEKAGRGCLSQVGIPAALVTALLALAVGLLIVWLESGNGSSKSATSASASSCSQTGAGARADHLEFIDCEQPSGLDGHWVLISGLTNPKTDMPSACDEGCQNLYTVTVDKPEATIDIQGTKITGGTYKTGYTATHPGDQCPFEEKSKLDATVSGGVDLNQNYGTLVIDGTATDFSGCDSNYQPRQDTDPRLNHTSRLFYVKGGTLFLCQGLNATFDGCIGPNGGAPAQPVATFQRG